MYVLKKFSPAYKGTVGAEFLTKELEVEEGKVVQFRVSLFLKNRLILFRFGILQDKNVSGV